MALRYFNRVTRTTFVTRGFDPETFISEKKWRYMSRTTDSGEGAAIVSWNPGEFEMAQRFCLREEMFGTKHLTLPIIDELIEPWVELKKATTTDFLKKMQHANLRLDDWCHVSFEQRMINAFENSEEDGEAIAKLVTLVKFCADNDAELFKFCSKNYEMLMFALTMDRQAIQKIVEMPNSPWGTLCYYPQQCINFGSKLKDITHLPKLRLHFPKVFATMRGCHGLIPDIVKHFPSTPRIDAIEVFDLHHIESYTGTISNEHQTDIPYSVIAAAPIIYSVVNTHEELNRLLDTIVHRPFTAEELNTYHVNIHLAGEWPDIPIAPLLGPLHRLKIRIKFDRLPPPVALELSKMRNVIDIDAGTVFPLDGLFLRYERSKLYRTILFKFSGGASEFELCSGWLDSSFYIKFPPGSFTREQFIATIRISYDICLKSSLASMYVVMQKFSNEFLYHDIEEQFPPEWRKHIAITGFEEVTS